MGTVLVIGNGMAGGLGSINGLAWIAVTLGLGFYYQRGRRDLVILAMLVAGVICVSLRIVGEWLLRLEPGVWAALPLAAAAHQMYLAASGMGHGKKDDSQVIRAYRSLQGRS